MVAIRRLKFKCSMAEVSWLRLDSMRIICGRCWPWWRAHDWAAQFALLRPRPSNPHLAGSRAYRHAVWIRPAGGTREGCDGGDPTGGSLFVFRSRRGDRLKILVWDRDGFLMWYKRLEAGVFKLPRVREGARSIELRASELAMILDGIDVSKLKRVPRYQRARSSKEINEKIMA